MAIREDAQHNHAQLFPNHESTLRRTEPELVDLFESEQQLAGHVAGNLSVGNDRRMLVSTVTHLLPFIGYPRTLNALRVINQGTKENGS